MAARCVVLLLAFAWPLLGGTEPFGYAINSDDEVDPNQLLRIDLATGDIQPLGQLPLIDIEGLALSREGMLYGVDDGTKSLVRIDPNNGAMDTIGNLGFPQTERRDFGLSFACDGRLLLVAEQTGSLYQVDLDSGQATVIGTSGGLAAPMTALAVRQQEVFGLAADTSMLHRINSRAGTASAVGPIDLNVSDAGMSFDADGNLWAILDGSTTDPSAPAVYLPSRILQIDPASGAATQIAETRTGIESLAIAAPAACVLGPDSPNVQPVPLASNLTFAIMLLLLALIGAVALRKPLN